MYLASCMLLFVSFLLFDRSSDWRIHPLGMRLVMSTVDQGSHGSASVDLINNMDLGFEADMVQLRDLGPQTLSLCS